MMASELALKKQLEDTLEGLNECIADTRDRAERRGISPYQLQYKDGQFIMYQLLCAKGQVLQALAILE